MNAKSNLNPRIDKWLWAVRIFKTRTMAANACKKGKVRVNGINVKPSHSVRIGEIIEVEQPPITRTYRVTGLIEKRVSASLAVDYVEETTPPQEIKRLRMMRGMTSTIVGVRDKGAGRPTKRERRAIDKLKKEMED
jgi:ribosome-associated heat shock protein Hsp15